MDAETSTNLSLGARVLAGRALDTETLLGCLCQDTPLLPLLHEAFQVRSAHFGRRVQIHVLNNAQNARCPEDCGYCAQSAVTTAPVRPYALKSREELVAEAHAAHAAGAFRYCIVASGRGPSERHVSEIAAAVRQIKSEVGVQVCVSAGLLDEAKALVLKDAGVDRFNHNLNTSAEHYPEICTTHDFADRLRTLKAAQQAGLELCSGMIAGMGESDRDIVEVALELCRMQVPSIPVNFLIPIDGNPVQSDGTLTPERALRILALFRLANPNAEIRVAGGREGHLGAMEPLALFPANSLFIQGYLTTRGEAPQATYRMIRDAGFEVERADGSVISWEELGLDDRFRVQGDTAIVKSELLQIDPPHDRARRVRVRDRA